MKGQLVTTFVEPGESGKNRWLDVWLFQDGTLNVVLASGCPRTAMEHVFPCAPYHLRNLLDGGTLHTSCSDGCVHMKRDGDRILISYRSLESEDAWCQVLSVDAVESVLEEVERLGRSYCA